MARAVTGRMGTAPLGRDFTLLCTGQAVSQLGSRGYGVAIMMWVLAETGSAVTVGLVSSVTLAVSAAVRLPAGWAVDRFDRRRVMVVCDTASALAVGSLALTPFALSHVLGSAAVLAVGWAARNTAESAALANVVADDRLQHAFTIVQGRGYATGIAGPLLAGALFVVDPRLPFVVDAVSYLIAGGCAAALRRPLHAAAPAAPSGSGAGLTAGIRLVLRHPFLRMSTLVAAATAFSIGSSALAMVVVLERNGVESTIIASAFTATYVGGLVGTAAAGWAGRRHRAAQLIVAGLTVAVLGSALMLIGTPVPVFLTCLLLQLAQPVWWIPTATAWTRLVPDDIRGRADAAVGVAVASATAVAPWVTGVLIDVATPRGIGVLLLVLLGATALVTGAGLTASSRQYARQP